MPPVDPRSYVPKYAQVAADLRRRITSGEYGPGSNLPAVADLAEDYEVSAATVRRALAALEAERLITTDQGVLARVREMRELTVERLRPGESAIVRPATVEEQRDLRLAEGTPVMVITGADGEERVRPAYDVRLVGGGD